MARICVYCSSSERIDPRYPALAREVGEELARRGHDLVSGGGRVSMMGEVARAVRAGGRHTIGVIPQALTDREVADVAADQLVVTRDMRERKGLMDAEADAFLALPGGLGTLEELLEVWVARSLGMHDRPVVVLDPDGLFAPLHELVGTLRRTGFVHDAAADCVVWTSTPAAALDAVEAELGAGPPVREPAELAEELLEADTPG